MPLLCGESLALIVFDMIVQIPMKDGEIEERHGGICVMLGVEVRLPKQPPHEPV